MDISKDPKASSRLISLDAFRGFTIAGMIIVNNPGSWDHVYAPALHAEWHGLTPTDLVFPFFLFIMGVSVVLAFEKRIEKGASRGDLFKKAVVRSVKIFALGLFLNLFPDFNFSEMRWAGVLQRIAMVYLCCAALFLKTSWKTQAILGAATLVFYWIAMTWIPFPGRFEDPLTPGVNLAAWIDSLLLPGTMWQGSWDPEGLFSTLPAIVTGLAGMLAARILRLNIARERQIVWLFVAGLAAMATGEAWSWTFPLNKNLWTSSYTLYTAGLAAMVFAALIWFVDVLNQRRWAQFGIIYGSNAISIYVLAGMLPALIWPATRWFFESLQSTGMAPKLASLLWAVCFCLICFIPAYILYRKRIFIKV